MTKQAKSFLGFDVGLKRIGVAVGQNITGTASPLPTITTKAGQPPWQKIDELITTWHPYCIIIGMPIDSPPGINAPIIAFITSFIAELQKRYGLPIHTINEHLTTKAARERIFKKGGYKALVKEEIDSIAAKIILEAWMHEQ